MTLNNNNSSTPLNYTISIDEVLCSNVQISITGIEKIRQETSKDVTLQHLKCIITYGWPVTQRECSKNLHMFWNYRDELSVENLMVFKGDRIVVPATLQHTILRHFHEAHMGREKMLLHARSAVLFVLDLLQMLTTWQKHTPKHGQYQILVHEPTAIQLWSKLVSDIFDIKRKSYIIIADYYSRFPYVKQLPNITSRSIINVFKPLFVDYGFCDILVTDNHMGHRNLKLFFETAPSNILPAVQCTLPQSNGFAESMVKVMKNIITKYFEANEDPNW